jgi:uncharacterized protein
MFTRLISSILEKAATSFPVTALTGPRQSGKTTLLQSLFPHYNYVSLESPDQLMNMQDDPRGFLNQSNKPWIIDEAQNFPALFSYIQEFVDREKKPGQFILSGSQNFLLSQHISQSLAGRVAILELLPLSYQEFNTSTHSNNYSLWQFLYQGTYPRPYQENLDSDLWFNAYIKTYLERDVRNIINIQNLTKFQLFLRLCAGQHGQQLNLSSLAQICGISQTTATDWLSILEASYIVFRLQPYFNNFKKRLVKTPKLYFYDPGLVCKLLGIHSYEHLQLHSNRGAIFEGFIIAEIIKLFFAKGKTAPIYYWRDHGGHEVDLLVEYAGNLLAFEIKSGMTLTKDFIKGIHKWQSITNIPKKHCHVIYAGEEKITFQDITILSWKSDFDTILN